MIGKSFIVTFHKVLLSTDLCNRLFSIIILINLVHTCLFHKGFCMVYFGDKKDDLMVAYLNDARCWLQWKINERLCELGGLESILNPCARLDA